MLLSLAVLLALSPEPAPVASAPERFDEARAHFDSGRYDEAARLFSELHVQTGDAALLYPTAQSLRLAGRCDEAALAYDQFLAAADQLRARAESAAAGSGVKRLASDLVYAGARVVEMRTCAARPKAEDARALARPLAAAGDSAAAIAVLSPVWIQTQDATLLPDIAALHQERGDCPQAGELLDLAVKALAPIEALRETGTTSAPQALATAALKRARLAKQSLTCEGAPVAKTDATVAGASLPRLASHTPPPPDPTAGAVSSPFAPVNGREDRSPSSTKPRWPLWVAGGGAALVAAGGVCLLLAAQAESEFDSLKGMPDKADDATSLRDRGETLDLVGIGLTATGAAVATGALIYYFVADRVDPGAGPSAQLSTNGAAFSWKGRF